MLADGVDLALVCVRPALVVRLLASDGSPLRSVAMDFKQQHWLVRRVSSRVPHEWPRDPRPIVRSQDGGMLFGRSMGDGETVFEVPPEGGDYFVGAMGPGFDGRLRIVHVPKDSGVVPVVLRALPTEPLGLVRLRVSHRDGMLESRPWDEPAIDLFVEHIGKSGGMHLLERDSLWDAPMQFELPAGRYRVTANGVASVNDEDGLVVMSRRLGLATAEISVAAGATVDADLYLDAGARLEILLSRPDGDSADTSQGSASVWLERNGRWVESVLRTVPGGEGHGTALTTAWPIDELTVSEIVPTGSFVLNAVGPGGVSVTQNITIVEGQTHRVQLTMGPRSK